MFKVNDKVQLKAFLPETPVMVVLDVDAHNTRQRERLRVGFFDDNNAFHVEWIGGECFMLYQPQSRLTEKAIRKMTEDEMRQAALDMNINLAVFLEQGREDKVKTLLRAQAFKDHQSCE